jgi:hypothetical protein
MAGHFGRGNVLAVTCGRPDVTHARPLAACGREIKRTDGFRWRVVRRSKAKWTTVRPQSMRQPASAR